MHILKIFICLKIGCWWKGQNIASMNFIAYLIYLAIVCILVYLFYSNFNFCYLLFFVNNHVIPIKVLIKEFFTLGHLGYRAIKINKSKRKKMQMQHLNCKGRRLQRWRDRDNIEMFLHCCFFAFTTLFHHLFCQ